VVFRYRLANIAAVVLALGLPLASAQGTAATAPTEPHAARPSIPFALVGETVITTAEYDAALAAAQRNRFYHAKVPEAQLEQLRREVGDELINRVLLVEDARRRSVEPDHARVKTQLDEYEKRYGASPQWPRMKAEMLPALTAELERRSILARIEADVRNVSPPSDSALREFHRQRPQTFTEPEQIKVSIILLKVDPAAPRAGWEGAREEAAAIRARIQRGADFGELARLHSADASASKGGDMGYLHRGMLPEAVQDKVDKLTTSEVSEPVTTLEGVVLIRVDDRKSARPREFEDVRERAQQLWQREEGERAWRAYLAQLRTKARIQVVDASRYPPAPVTGDKGDASPIAPQAAPRVAQ